jgi:predicted transcriptional regulator
MCCIWDLGAATPRQVAEHLLTKLGEELSPKTVGIFLARLEEEKGCLQSSPSPALATRGLPPYVYEALVSREQSLKWQLERFLDDYLVDEDGFEILETLLSSARISRQRSLQP